MFCTKTWYISTYTQQRNYIGQALWLVLYSAILLAFQAYNDIRFSCVLYIYIYIHYIISVCKQLRTSPLETFARQFFFSKMTDMCKTVWLTVLLQGQKTCNWHVHKLCIPSFYVHVRNIFSPCGITICMEVRCCTSWTMASGFFFCLLPHYANTVHLNDKNLYVYIRSDTRCHII